MSVRLRSRIPEIEHELDPKVTRALKMGAETIAQEAKGRVPVETGALRNSIHVDKIADGYAVIAGDGNAFYGHMVEHGTTYAGARPFLTPAFEAQRAEIERMVRAALRSL